MMNWGGGWGMGVGMIMMAVFWVIVITALVFFVRWLVHSLNGRRKSHEGDYKEDNALDILKKIYARGEIDKQEFEQKKKDIE
jgi:putative membrane protein